MGLLSLTLHRDEYRNSFLLHLHHIIELNKVSLTFNMDIAIQFRWLEGNVWLKLVRIKDNTQDLKSLFSQFKDVFKLPWCLMNTLHFAIKCNLKPLSIVIGPSTPSPVLIRRYVDFVEVWLEAAADKGALFASQLLLLSILIGSKSATEIRHLVIFIRRAADVALIGSI